MSQSGHSRRRQLAIPAAYVRTAAKADISESGHLIARCRSPRHLDIHARGRGVRIDKLCKAREPRDHLFEDLQASPHQVGCKRRQSGCVPARPSEALHQFALNRVGDEHENNRDRSVAFFA
jgi:hypothetical protein